MKRTASRVAKEIASYLRGGEIPKETLQGWVLALAPPAPKRRTRDPRTVARRATTKELDQLCREVVFARDGNLCRRCGKPAVDWSHCYSRRYKWLRWDLDNSWASCKGCHLEWHHRPAEGTLWWAETLGTAANRALILRAAKPRKVDTSLVRLYLETAAKNQRPI